MENCNQGDLKLSIQSLRAGSAITKLLEGQSLKKVMSDAYWKNPSTAWRYIKLLQVFFPFRDFGLELDALCPEDYAKLNSTPPNTTGKMVPGLPFPGKHVRADRNQVNACRVRVLIKGVWVGWAGL